MLEKWETFSKQTLLLSKMLLLLLIYKLLNALCRNCKVLLQFKIWKGRLYSQNRSYSSSVAEVSGLWTQKNISSVHYVPGIILRVTNDTSVTENLNSINNPQIKPGFLKYKKMNRIYIKCKVFLKGILMLCAAGSHLRDRLKPKRTFRVLTHQSFIVFSSLQSQARYERTLYSFCLPATFKQKNPYVKGGIKICLAGYVCLVLL